MSQSEIDSMVSEAEQYKVEHEANKGKVEAKNGLEIYCFSMRNTLEDETLKEKFEGGDRKTSKRPSRKLWTGWTIISLQKKDWAANSQLQGEELLALADTKKLEECKAQFEPLTKTSSR